MMYHHGAFLILKSILCQYEYIVGRKIMLYSVSKFDKFKRGSVACELA